MRSLGPVALLAVSLALAGCSVTRLEDVPSSQALDQSAGLRSRDLSVPPDLTRPQASPTATTAGAGDAMPSDIGEGSSTEEYLPATPRAVIERPPADIAASSATWIARYVENGIDAESADGGYCSGQRDWSRGGPSVGQRIAVACSDGQMATLVIKSKDANAMNGDMLMAGKTETVRILLPN